jgi:hypothetical protein
VLKRKRPQPSLNSFDRLFWTTLDRLGPRWTDPRHFKSEAVIVHGEIVVDHQDCTEQVRPGFFPRLRLSRTLLRHLHRQRDEESCTLAGSAFKPDVAAHHLVVTRTAYGMPLALGKTQVKVDGRLPSSQPTN